MQTNVSNGQSPYCGLGGLFKSNQCIIKKCEIQSKMVSVTPMVDMAVTWSVILIMDVWKTEDN